MERQENPWIRRFIKRDQAVARLFCFPFAGGGTQTFASWADHLPDTLDIYAVRLPGREIRMRERPQADLHGLLDGLVAAVRPLLDRPFFLYGHSMGALLAYEFARRLARECGVSPVCLFVSARVAPQCRLPREPISGLDQDAFVEELRRLNGTPPEVLEDTRLMAMISPMLRADLAIDENYVYRSESRLYCDLMAFGGLCDRETGLAGLDAWREVTEGGFTLHMLAGDHFFIHAAHSGFLRMLSIHLADFLWRLSTEGRGVSAEAIG